MQCPIDKTEMEKGDLAVRGGHSKFMWMINKKRGFLESFASGPEVTTYHCPKCGKVELTTETK